MTERETETVTLSDGTLAKIRAPGTRFEVEATDGFPELDALRAARAAGAEPELSDHAQLRFRALLIVHGCVEPHFGMDGKNGTRDVYDLLPPDFGGLADRIAQLRRKAIDAAQEAWRPTPAGANSSGPSDS